MIDPIDGTSDYINDLDEFTINAGLIINKSPAAGLICAPAKKRMFYSFGENSAYELIDGNPFKLDSAKNFDKNEIKFVIIFIKSICSSHISSLESFLAILYLYLISNVV